MKTTYEYASLPVARVLELTNAEIKPADSYLSDDENSRALSNLLKSGFRWIRTDGEIAVFERSVIKYPAMEKRG